MGKRIHNLEGKQYSYFTVLELSNEKDIDKKRLWRCECICGNIRFVHTRDLLNENKHKSCGCMKSELLKQSHTTHGQTNTRLYEIWGGMKARCYNPSHTSYPYYGAKGITVCDDWSNSFTSFSEWALENGYEDYLTIDRVDSKGIYEPSNCQWITKSENSRKASIKS